MKRYKQLFEGKKYIAYHGGKDIKDSFNISEIGSMNNELIFGKGFYFTSEYDMAVDFASKVNGYVYTVEISAKKPFILSQKEFYKRMFDDYNIETDEDEEQFFNDIYDKYDCLIITDRKFGGGMKFSNEYMGFTEYVVYNPSIIKILKKERY